MILDDNFFANKLIVSTRRIKMSMTKKNKPALKVTIFNGSPKGRKSNTGIIVDCLSQGMIEAGATVEKVYLSEFNIKQCCGCMLCFTLHPGKCVIIDDMKPLLSKYASSDLIGLATPLYNENMTGLMKNFIDRTLPLVNCHIENDESGNFYHNRLGKKEQRMFVVSNCGLPGENNFRMLKEFLGRYNPIAGIYRSAGMALLADGGDVKIYGKRIISRIRRYKKDLLKSGREIIKKGSISPKLMMRLEEPLEDDSMIMERTNQYFEKIGEESKSGIKRADLLG